MNTIKENISSINVLNKALKTFLDLRAMQALQVVKYRMTKYNGCHIIAATSKLL